MNKNIKYESSEIAAFYGQNRTSWSTLYPSERWVFERVAEEGGGLGSVLDVGCAAGGLGRALSEKDFLKSYTGIDINHQAIEEAKVSSGKISCANEFHEGDILSSAEFTNKLFDTVVSLSCVDWNVEYHAMISRCWAYVRPGGRFILSVRLTDQKSITDISESSQYVAFSDVAPEQEEIAPYAVFNVSHMLHLLTRHTPPPSQVLGYGYWGPPSVMARTPLEEVLFTVFAVTKSGDGDGQDISPRLELHLPWSIWREGD